MINIQQTGIKTQDASLQNLSKGMYIEKNIRDVEMYSNNEKHVSTDFLRLQSKHVQLQLDNEKVKAGATGRFFKYYPINSRETE